jgi:hypothetical protein
MRVVRSEPVGRMWVMTAIALCLLGIIAAACRGSTPAPAAQPTQPPPSPSPVPPTATPRPSATPLPTARFAPTPGPALPSLSDADAIALIKEAVLRYGATEETVRISVAGEPRSVTVRYASALSTDQGVFDLQRILSTIAVARIAVRLEPPPAAGLSVGIIPAGDADVGLFLTLIDGETLARWTRGELNDVEFVRQWEMGAMTRE